MAKKKNDYATIPVFPNTKKKLEQMGNKGETWDEIINKLIRMAGGS